MGRSPRVGRFRPSFPSSLGRCVSACSIQPSTLAGRLVRSKSVTHSTFCLVGPEGLPQNAPFAALSAGFKRASASAKP